MLGSGQGVTAFKNSGGVAIGPDVAEPSVRQQGAKLLKNPSNGRYENNIRQNRWIDHYASGFGLDLHYGRPRPTNRQEFEFTRCDY
jgi:hypothetical protein